MPSRLVRKFDPTLDVGKVLGAFFISGIVHASAGISINGGRPSETFEWLFFWCSGIAVIVEEAVQRLVHKLRGDRRPRWYDAWVGRVWTVTVLLWSGQYFTRGWFDSGLVEVSREVLVVSAASLADYTDPSPHPPPRAGDGNVTRHSRQRGSDHLYQRARMD